PKCRWGLWTNGLEFFFTEREDTAFDTRFKPIGHWPMADETQSSQAAYSKARMRRADPEMLRVAFRRCHNFIHGNEGMSKDAAFWQFLFLIFCKMYDERQPREERQFWAGPDEMFNAKGHKAIQARILKLFEQVKKRYVGSQNAFRNGDEITLSERAMAFMVGELAKYDFTHTDLEAKGAAYQEIVGNNLRGDRGQY
ncbi:MAG: restriction endonuclease subunit M, partial [Gammaproteobacteria bacterium]|nr:restriction endonuclease subunit M [Gammaproteobacteria bacterium]